MLSEEAHNVLVDFKKSHGHSNLDVALNALLLDYYKSRQLFR